jgi:hypothetical protein
MLKMSEKEIPNPPSTFKNPPTPRFTPRMSAHCKYLATATQALAPRNTTP